MVVCRSQLPCPSCGKPISPTDKFCTACGAKLDASQVSVASTAGSVFSGSEFIIEQKIVALRDTFGIKDRNGNLLAYVKRKIVSWGPQFWFESPDGARLGDMHGKVLALRPTFEICDPQGLVAVVKKKVLKLLGSEWWLEDNSGREIARIKGNIMAHDFSMYSSSGTEIARIHKKWVTVRDSYGIEVLDREIDPYIIIAYSIAMDNAQWKADSFAIGVGGIGLGGMIDNFGTRK